MPEYQVVFLEQPHIGQRCKILYNGQQGHTDIVTNVGRHPGRTDWIRTQTASGTSCVGPIAASSSSDASRPDEFAPFRRQKEAYAAACLYNDRHFTDYKDSVTTLLRQGDVKQAESLLLGILDTVERAATVPIPDMLDPTLPPYYHSVPPDWYRRLAILYRKQKRYADEVVLIERYLKQPGAGVGYDTVAERLPKARLLLTQSKSR